MPEPQIITDDAGIERRIRRFAVLRAAQRALREVASEPELEQDLDQGRRLLRRLRVVSGREDAQTEVVEPRQALASIDQGLERLAERLRARLQSVPVRTLCGALDAMVGPEAGALRALAAVALEGDLRDDGHLARVEMLITLLCVEGLAGERQVVRAPLEALPELARIDLPEAYEAHPDIDEAEQVLGRAVVRLDQDDAGAARDRILAFKRRLGPRLLHPTVLAASVAYNTEMGNRLSRLLDDHHALDGFADTLLGLETDATRQALNRAARLPATAAPAPKRSRLLWRTLATAGLAVGLVCLAVWLWPRSSVHVLPTNSAAEVSPFLNAGYVSQEDGESRFVGTVEASWHALSLEERRRTVARIAAVLAGRGIGSITLIDARQAMQARYEDESLLWLSSPAMGTP